MKKIGEKYIIFTASLSPIKLYKNFIITSLWNTNVVYCKYLNCLPISTLMHEKKKIFDFYIKHFLFL